MVNQINSVNLWNSLFSSPDFVIFIINAEGLILDINHTAVSVTKDDVVGKMRIQDFYPEETKHIPLNALNCIFVEN